MSIRTKEHAHFLTLLELDSLPSEEMAAWLVCSANHARHSRYSKAARTYIDCNCGRPNCVVTGS